MLKKRNNLVLENDRKMHLITYKLKLYIQENGQHQGIRSDTNFHIILLSMPTYFKCQYFMIQFSIKSIKERKNFL